MAETAREFIAVEYAHRANRFLSFPSVRITILPVQPNKLETLDDLMAHPASTLPPLIALVAG